MVNPSSGNYSETGHEKFPWNSFSLDKTLQRYKSPILTKLKENKQQQQQKNPTYLGLLKCLGRNTPNVDFSLGLWGNEYCFLFSVSLQMSSNKPELGVYSKDKHIK